jgi:hypothetical protein
MILLVLWAIHIFLKRKVDNWLSCFSSNIVSNTRGAIRVTYICIFVCAKYGVLFTSSLVVGIVTTVIAE